MPEKAMYHDHPLPADRNAVSKLGRMWCDLMHDAPMWPMHGQYECRTCGRRYPVRWD